MKNLSKAFAISSLLFLGVLAVSPVKDRLSEWRSYQKAYNRLLLDQPRRIKPAEVRIRQVWNPDLDRTDRCVSCHLGVEEKDLVGATQPFTPHPRIHHDINAFGCTVCHGGQGQATTVAEAHGLTEFWDRPLLPGDDMEASCGRCHTGRAPANASILAQGRELIQEANCAGCHAIQGVQKGYVPSLDGVGDKVGRSWLARWLKSPRSFRPKTRMPDFHLSDEEVGLLSDFLMTFKTYPLGIAIDPLPPELRGENLDKTLVELGKTRIAEARCISCHAIEGKGGHLAPDLAKIASKASRQWIYTFLRDPKALLPDVQMPQYGFTPKERVAVAAYMISEWVDWDAPPEDRAAVPTSDPNSYEKGLALFKHYNCGGCHSLSGVTGEGEPGPDLSAVGDRRIYELEFGPTKIEQSLPSYLYNKLKNPRQFFQNSRMPDFGFDEPESQAVTTALLAMTSQKLPDAYRPATPPVSAYHPQGPFGAIVKKYACFSCHVINGQGTFLASDLSREGSAVNRQWLEDFFQLPYSMRPTLPERMPKFFMSDQEVKTIADYFQGALRDDSMDSIHVDPQPALVAEGKRLFFDVYGCQGCHQVGGKGGYVGPPLDRSGNRLTSGWVYRWLKNPQQYVPQTVEPNNGLKEDELRSLTAFVMSLKQEGGQR